MFDDPNLVSAAGLLPVLALAESAGLYERLAGLTVPSPNRVVKAAGVVAGMLAGPDCIDDLDLLRHGAMTTLFGGVRAPLSRPVSRHWRRHRADAVAAVL